MIRMTERPKVLRGAGNGLSPNDTMARQLTIVMPLVLPSISTVAVCRAFTVGLHGLGEARECRENSRELPGSESLHRDPHRAV